MEAAACLRDLSTATPSPSKCSTKRQVPGLTNRSKQVRAFARPPPLLTCILPEIGHLSKARHPHINKLLAVSFNGLYRCLVLDLMEEGALDQRLCKRPALPWHDRARILLHVARGLVFMHQLNPPIIHRDVKCANVLLAYSSNSKLVAKVSDFGGWSLLCFFSLIVYVLLIHQVLCG